MVTELGIGLIGTGFMGKCHALAFRAAPAVFAGLPKARLALLADVDAAVTERAAASWGFARWTTDWQALVQDPSVDLVAITTPNFLHQPMALAALAAGKHVYCEKPLALDAAGAKAMAEAAAAAGRRTLVGYNYLRNPLLRLAKELIEADELGRIVHFRGTHFEDYMTDPAAPHTWRCARATAGAGAVGDLGSHCISLARYLCGEIASVQGASQTFIRERPAAGAADRRLPVDVDDQTQALLRFASGAAGTLEASWLAAGRKMGLRVEVTGSQGALALDYERMNELQLFTYGGPQRTHGFKTILVGPEHPDFAPFCPAPGHGLGFNDLKVIEVKALLAAIADGGPLGPDFAEAAVIAQVVEAIQRSAENGGWVEVATV